MIEAQLSLGLPETAPLQPRKLGFSGAAITTLGQLFTGGPVWDGNVASKVGRGELVEAGLARHAFGWAWLVEDGIRVAIAWDRRDLARRGETRWLEKLRSS